MPLLLVGVVCPVVIVVVPSVVSGTPSAVCWVTGGYSILMAVGLVYVGASIPPECAPIGTDDCASVFTTIGGLHNVVGCVASVVVLAVVIVVVVVAGSFKLLKVDVVVAAVVAIERVLQLLKDDDDDVFPPPLGEDDTDEDDTTTSGFTSGKSDWWCWFSLLKDPDKRIFFTLCGSSSDSMQ